MEVRLLPANAMLGLLSRGDLNPATLADVGYRLIGLEIPIVGPDGRVVADMVLFHDETGQVLLLELKSGANVDESQAGRYAQLEPNAVVQATGVSVPSRAQITVEVAYVCLADHAARIRQGLEAAGLACPLIVVAERHITLDRPDSRGTALDVAWTSGPIELHTPVVELLPFDHDSPASAFDAAVRAELIAELSHRRSEVTVRLLTERVVPFFALFARSAQTQLLRKVREVARTIVDDNPDNYAYVPSTHTRPDDAVAFLKTPEDLDTRGRTQAYQALQQRRGAGRVRIADRQTDLLDLLAETVTEGPSHSWPGQAETEGEDPGADQG